MRIPEPNQKQDTPVFKVGKTETRRKSNRALPFHTTYDADGNVEIDSRTTGLNVALGEVMWLPPSPPHSAENVSDGEIRDITVELKD